MWLHIHMRYLRNALGPLPGRNHSLGKTESVKGACVKKLLSRPQERLAIPEAAKKWEINNLADLEHAWGVELGTQKVPEVIIK